MTIATSAIPERSLDVPLVSVLTVLVVFTAIQFGAYSIAGRFEYPLDDVYIHLAMADGIAAGGYGVNAGEYASAASSPLYPYLLAPFSGLDVQRYIPLVINILALISSAWLWSRIAIDALGRSGTGVVVAVFGMVALNLPQLAFTGMEHALHVLTTLAVVRGLQQLSDEGRVTLVLVTGMILGPLIRFEAMAVSVAAVLFLILDRRVRIGILLAALSILPVISFMYFLTTLGLDPLPNSVNAKLGVRPVSDEGVIIAKFTEIALKLRGLAPIAYLLFLFITVVNLLRACRGEDRKLLIGLAAASFAGIGHLIFGQFGWMDRYEIYMLTFLAAMLVVAAGRIYGSRQGTLILGIVAGMAVCAAQYLPNTVRSWIYAPASISLQHNQMARFAQTYLKAPVGVNDLGLVVWRNPNYVLDLWGLASKDALDTRRNRPERGWGGPLVRASHVEMVMIYDRWLADSVASDWVRLGILDVTRPTGVLDFDPVTFYATHPDAVEHLTAKLDAFIPTLPPGATFERAGAGE